jgi:phosphatidylglycerol:prolipoprotein diacylglycerol transferase
LKPILFDLGGVEFQSYGLSKALAAIAAWFLLSRELRRRGLDSQLAYSLVLAGVVGGFAGAKLYFLAEHAGSLTAHDLGGMGFTWFGGLIGGAAAVAWVARRHEVALAVVAGMTPIPLAVAYGIGRLGCLLAGDGTYGVPSDLPWAMSFPDGTVPTTERVHPTPLYEALAAFAVAALIWRLRPRLNPTMLFGIFAVLMGVSRFLVEFIRLNDETALGLSQPQIWSLVLVAIGCVVAYRAGRFGRGPLIAQPAGAGPRAEAIAPMSGRRVARGRAESASRGR